MAKQQELKEIRNYHQQPRRHGEFDPEHRGDLDHFDQSRTKQSDTEGCDINKIIARYSETGIWPEPEHVGQYGDFDLADSFVEAQNIVARANSQFMGLPAEVRATFSNDPKRMLEYIEDAKSDTKKADRLLELGLIIPVVEPEESQTKIMKDIRDGLKTKSKPDSGESNGK